MKGFARLYGTASGRVLLRLLTKPALSRAAGWYLSTRLSRMHIGFFVEKSGIDLAQFGGAPYRSFNDFFTRPVLRGKRPFDLSPTALCSPCDSRLTAYTLSEDADFAVKGISYTLRRLLRDDALAARFSGGTALVFRLCVGDYHRYCWFDGGVPEPFVHINGLLHTVRPAATERRPVFCENSREYTVIRTERFGTAVQMEVGAMMVGKIRNHPVHGSVRRGEEKGYFEFGGSTVILLLQRGTALLRPDILAASARGEEICVRQGERIGSTAEG